MAVIDIDDYFLSRYGRTWATLHDHECIPAPCACERCEDCPRGLGCTAYGDNCTPCEMAIAKNVSCAEMRERLS